jgi:hypothetical protein
VKDVLLFLAKFLVLSLVLFVAFTAAEEHYYKMLAHMTATLAPLTGSSMEVSAVEGNTMKFIYSGMEVPARLTFAAFNPVILLSLLVATPRVGRRIFRVAIGGFALLLIGQVITLRLLLAMLVRGYGASPGLEFLEILTLVSICVNWVLPIIIWIVWVPTGFLARALKTGFSQNQPDR